MYIFILFYLWYLHIIEWIWYGTHLNLAYIQYLLLYNQTIVWFKFRICRACFEGNYYNTLPPHRNNVYSVIVLWRLPYCVLYCTSIYKIISYPFQTMHGLIFAVAECPVRPYNTLPHILEIWIRLFPKCCATLM